VVLVKVVGGNINALTPFASGLYAINSPGLKLVSDDSNLQLAIAGDINYDGNVDGVDSQLLD
jgi:hypothetical protein